VLSTSIDKFVYLAVHRYFYPDHTLLKYSRTERVRGYDEIQHPIFRECLTMLDLHGLDISSMADVPAGTGLGSSSSFTVSLLHVLHAYKNETVNAEYLASKACEIEIERLGDPIGKQDQYAAAYGGLNLIEFNPDDSVSVQPVLMDDGVKNRLSDNLIMLYTGGTRSANAILAQQNRAMENADKRAIMRRMASMAYSLKDILEEGRIDDFGRMLHEGWMLKQSVSGGISNPEIAATYEKGLRAGALGGKLLGAGGSGFLLFYCPEEKQDQFREAMSEYREMPFNFTEEGSSIIYRDV